MSLTAIDGTARPDYGPGWRDRVCATCGAGWVGHVRDGDWCPWCETRVERQRAEERRRLLHPEWLRCSDGDPRYDALSALDRAVWDRTRGHDRCPDTPSEWARALARGVARQLITQTEADHALTRAERICG